MGKAAREARRKGLVMGVDARHPDFGPLKSPDPDGVLKRLLAGDPDTEPEREHHWLVSVVYDLDGGDAAARDLAILRRANGGALEWDPGDAEPLRIEGPWCAACYKLRGPGAVTTKCAEAGPAAIERARAEDDLKAMPRKARRSVDARRRRLERARNAELEATYGPSPMKLAKNRKRATFDPGRPQAVHMIDPDPAKPEDPELKPAVVFKAA